jgi:hypothetical protein
MDKEDDIFKHQMGQENPFRVPEGYFEDLVSSISTRFLDENQSDISLHPHRRIKLIGIAAASICAAIFGISVYFGRNEKQSTNVSVQKEVLSIKASVYNDIDRAVDYTMFDNEDIYAYVSDSDNE